MSTQNPNEYLLLFRGAEWYNDLSPEELQTAMNQVQAWFEGIKNQGILKAAQPLLREGKLVSGKQGRMVVDGPFAESKEVIGGYCLLSIKTEDEAVRIAQSCPGLNYGMQIEVRPVAEECPMAERAKDLGVSAEVEQAAV